jgi:hypothetical protein
MTHALVWIALALALVDCGKYGRPSRVGTKPPPQPADVSAPAPAEQCEETP